MESVQFSHSAAAAAKSLQLCLTLCDPTDGSPPGSPVPGILQARTLECVAISFFNACKWKVKVKSLSHVRLWRPHGLQPTRLLHPWDFPGKSTGVGCHFLLRFSHSVMSNSLQPCGPQHARPPCPSPSPSPSVDEVIYKISFEIMCAVCSQSFSQV